MPPFNSGDLPSASTTSGWELFHDTKHGCWMQATQSTTPGGYRNASEACSRRGIFSRPDKLQKNTFAGIMLRTLWQAVEKASKIPFWRRGVALKIHRQAVEKQLAALLSSAKQAR
jgi:hypothetical protein